MKLDEHESNLQIIALQAFQVLYYVDNNYNFHVVTVKSTLPLPLDKVFD